MRAAIDLGRDVMGINSVPTFVLNSRLGIPGMVPNETLLSVFREQLAAAAELPSRPLNGTR